MSKLTVFEVIDNMVDELERMRDFFDEYMIDHEDGSLDELSDLKSDIESTLDNDAYELKDRIKAIAHKKEGNKNE